MCRTCASPYAGISISLRLFGINKRNDCMGNHLSLIHI